MDKTRNTPGDIHGSEKWALTKVYLILVLLASEMIGVGTTSRTYFTGRDHISSTSGHTNWLAATSFVYFTVKVCSSLETTWNNKISWKCLWKCFQSTASGIWKIKPSWLWYADFFNCLVVPWEVTHVITNVVSTQQTEYPYNENKIKNQTSKQ